MQEHHTMSLSASDPQHTAELADLRCRWRVLSFLLAFCSGSCARHPLHISIQDDPRSPGPVCSCPSSSAGGQTCVEFPSGVSLLQFVACDPQHWLCGTLAASQMCRLARVQSSQVASSPAVPTRVSAGCLPGSFGNTWIPGPCLKPSELKLLVQ